MSTLLPDSSLSAPVRKSLSETTLDQPSTLRVSNHRPSSGHGSVRTWLSLEVESLRSQLTDNKSEQEVVAEDLENLKQHDSEFSRAKRFMNNLRQTDKVKERKELKKKLRRLKEEQSRLQLLLITKGGDLLTQRLRQGVAEKPSQP
jgi:hypothetical protein